jgi:hypothetical protein
MSTPVDARRGKANFIWLLNQDGLWDIFLGLGVLGIALDVAFNQDMWLIGMWLMGYFLVLTTGKEVITRPRMGHFNLGVQQQARIRKAAQIGLAVILSILILGAAAFLVIQPSGTSSQALLAENGGLFCAVITALCFSLFAHFGEGAKRYYLIAIFVLASFTVQRLLSAPVLPLLLSIAGVLLFSGVITLLTFVIRYPKIN